jgi:hypothetical protein
MAAPRPERRRRRHRGLFWVGLLVCATLIAAGGAYAYSGYRNGQGADGAVRGYLHALARGDAPSALSYGTIPAGSRTFLTSAVLRQQLRTAPMRDITIGADSTSGDDTKVAFSYDLAFGRGDQHVQDSVLVRKVGGRWQLDRVAMSVQLTLEQAGDRATFAGAAVPTGETLLFPGAVPIGFDSPYLRLTLATDQLPLSQSPEVELSVELTPAATSAISHRLAIMLTTCGQGGTGTAVARCPVPSPQFVPGSMSGTLVSQAGDLTLGVASTSEGTISISGTATFNGTYKLLDFNDVAHPHTGKVSVPFEAVAYAVSPLDVSFTVALG